MTEIARPDEISATVAPSFCACFTFEFIKTVQREPRSIGFLAKSASLAKSFTSYFKEYKEPKEETVIATPVSDLDVLIEPDVKDNSIEIKEDSEIITEDSTEKIEPVKKRTRNTKK